MTIEEIRKKHESVIQKYQEAADAIVEKKRTMSEECWRLQQIINYPELRECRKDEEDGLTLAELSTRLNTLRNKGNYAIDYNDEYRAAYKEFLETIYSDIESEDRRLEKEYKEALHEYTLMKQNYFDLLKSAEKKMWDYKRAASNLVMGIHREASVSCDPFGMFNDIRHKTLNGNPYSVNPEDHITCNLHMIELMDQKKSTKNDPEEFAKRFEIAYQNKQRENSMLTKAITERNIRKAEAPGKPVRKIGMIKIK